MKFVIFENHLLHECRRGIEKAYDNIYLIKNNMLTCEWCGGKAPLSITLGFKLGRATNGYYVTVGSSEKIFKYLRDLKMIEQYEHFTLNN